MKRLMNEPLALYIGDVIRLKKPHACGGYAWEVNRLGLDIGLQCTTCNRRILLPRLETERRFKSFESRGDPATAIQGIVSATGAQVDADPGGDE
jgi:hypothetical protein